MNRSVQDVLSKLEEVCGADEAFRRELTLTFIKEGDLDVARILEALDARDRNGLLALVHLWRGACATMGARELAECCAEAECALRAGTSTADAGDSIARALEAWPSLRAGLNAAIAA